MAKTRRRKSKAGEPTAEFVHVPTPDLVVLDNLDAITNLDVKGRFVKVSPLIPASQRDAFDGPGVAAKLREAGALAVIMAPIFRADTKKEVDTVTAAKSDRDAVLAWFDAQKIADVTDLNAALELVQNFMDLEGM